MNHITPPKSKYTDDHKSRRKYDLDKFRTWLRASPEELRMAARAFIEKLNKAKGPVTIIIPKKGWSSVDVPGSVTHDPVEDHVFIEELQKGLKPQIEVLEADANMEDKAFADAVIKLGLKMFGEKAAKNS